MFKMTHWGNRAPSLLFLVPRMQDSPAYDEQYYATSCGPLRYERSPHWINFFGQTAEKLISAVRPTRVFDAGCAFGFLVESFWDRGVYCEGVDVSEYAISQARRDMARYCRVQSLTEPIQGRFDLITCIEVLEHIDAEEADAVVANLCAAADTIFFSSTPTDFSEPTHVNVQPSKYWLDLFARHGFGPDTHFDGGFLTPHAFLLRKGLSTEEPVLRLFSEYLRLKIALLSKGVPPNTTTPEPTVKIEVYPFKERVYSAANCITKVIPANNPVTVSLNVAGPGGAPLRVDPGKELSVTQLESIAIRNAVSGQLLWAGHTAEEFEPLQVQGTATRLKISSSPWAMLSYGNDPQIILPEFDSSSADGFTLEIRLNVHVDKHFVANVMAGHLQQQAGECALLRKAADDANVAVRTKIEEIDSARDALRSLSQSASQTRYELSLARQRISELERVHAEAQSLNEQLAACRQTLDRVLTSVSWKFTKPLRDIMSAVRGGPRRLK
jgi:SAM-dependent methyltransferase